MSNIKYTGAYVKAGSKNLNEVVNQNIVGKCECCSSLNLVQQQITGTMVIPSELQGLQGLIKPSMNKQEVNINNFKDIENQMTLKVVSNLFDQTTKNGCWPTFQTLKLSEFTPEKINAAFLDVCRNFHVNACQNEDRVSILSSLLATQKIDKSTIDNGASLVLTGASVFTYDSCKMSQTYNLFYKYGFQFSNLSTNVSQWTCPRKCHELELLIGLGYPLELVPRQDTCVRSKLALSINPMRVALHKVLPVGGDLSFIVLQYCNILEPRDEKQYKFDSKQKPPPVALRYVVPIRKTNLIPSYKLQ